MGKKSIRKRIEGLSTQGEVPSAGGVSRHFQGGALTTSKQQTLLTIALMAAFADGEKADAEREAIRSLADPLGTNRVARAWHVRGG